MRYSSLLLLVTSVAAAVAKDDRVGTLAYVEGDVVVNKRVAKDGMKLVEGSTVVTRAGKATLLLGASNVIHLDHDTHFRVTRYKRKAGADQAVLDLSYGKTRALIKKRPGRKKFRLRTRSVTMGVRGTEVFLSSDRAGVTDVAVVGGEVVLAQNAALKQATAQKPAKQTVLKTNDTFRVSQGQERVQKVKAKEIQARAHAVRPKAMEVQSMEQMEKMSKKEMSGFRRGRKMGFRNFRNFRPRFLRKAAPTKFRLQAVDRHDL